MIHTDDGHVWTTNEDGVTVCRICGTKRGEGKMFVSIKLSPLASVECEEGK